MSKFTKHEIKTTMFFMRHGEIHPQGRKMPARIIAESEPNPDPENTHLYRKAIQRLVNEGAAIPLDDGGYALTEAAKKQCGGKAVQAVVQRPKYFMQSAGVLTKKVPRQADMIKLRDSIKEANFHPSEQQELKKKGKKILKDIPTTDDNKEFKALLKDSLED